MAVAIRGDAKGAALRLAGCLASNPPRAPRPARVLGDPTMMKTMQARLCALKADTRGVTAMEYGLIAAFIAVAIIGGLTLLGGNLDAMLNGIAAKFVAPT